MNLSKISLYESISFIIIANIIMLSGADFPPPPGFIWITLTSFIISTLQYFYCNWLLQTLGKRKTFFKTITSFALLGTLISLFFIFFNSEAINRAVFIFVGVVATVFSFYGFIFWMVNKIIQKYATNKKI